jgi:phosphoserine phosphatase RsbU/P
MSNALFIPLAIARRVSLTSQPGLADVKMYRPTNLRKQGSHEQAGRIGRLFRFRRIDRNCQEPWATDGSPRTASPNTVAKPASRQKHLKLYTEQPPKPVRPPTEAIASLPSLLRAFQAVTGASLQYQHGATPRETNGPAWMTPIQGELGRTTGHLLLAPQTTEEGPRANDIPTGPVASTTSSANPPNQKSLQTLANSIADLLGELLQTRHALRQREAELAAGVPVVPHPQEEKHLLTRLEAVLRAGAESVGCNAAGLYLLDDATTHLKLRCSYGLPVDRLAAPPRPLNGAIADLEALLGHAVVLDDTTLMQTWNVPEDFPSAVCVPVATPTTLLGTLWVFCNERRDFNDCETNILELVTGRLASDLEREMLMRAGVDGAKLKKQVAAAERLQRNELPAIAPLLDGWDVAGWTAQAENVGGAFHDWFCLPDGLLAVAVGRAEEQGIAGALTANSVKTALRSHARYHRLAERILQQVNLTLWTGSAGDQRVTLFHALVETSTGRVCWSSAGGAAVLLLHGDGWQSLSRSSGQLGEGPEAEFERFAYELRPGEALIVFADNSADAAAEKTLVDALKTKPDLSAAELVAAARSALDAQIPAHEAHDYSILAIKRTPA